VLLGSADERESCGANASTNAVFQLGLDACEELLADLDEQEIGAA
jgi:hypothetical protein